MGADGDGTGAGLLRQFGVEQRGALAVEARERLVQQEQLRLVQERAAERKPLPHSLRVRGDPFVANLPQPIALEQHPDALLALAHPIQAAVQLEVLERGELLVDERLVADVADMLSSHRNLELSSGRRQQACEETHERALTGPVRTRHEQEAAGREVHVDAVEHGLLAEAALETPGADDHTRTSASTNAKNVRLMTPFMVKKAVSSRRQSRGETSACS